jgi:Glycosyl transferase WecG/TagA/CpsF family
VPGEGDWIVAPKLDLLRQFTVSAVRRKLILAATHPIADGQPIVWASRLTGTPVPSRVPGSDPVVPMSEAAARAGLSVFLLGGNPGVAAAAAVQRAPPGEGGSAARESKALLQGLLRCGRGGRRMQVAYPGQDGNVPRHACAARGPMLHHTDSACQPSACGPRERSPGRSRSSARATADAARPLGRRAAAPTRPASSCWRTASRGRPAALRAGGARGR